MTFKEPISLPVLNHLLLYICWHFVNSSFKIYSDGTFKIELEKTGKCTLGKAKLEVFLSVDFSFGYWQQ